MARARLTETELLPTPPFPLPTAIALVVWTYPGWRGVLPDPSPGHAHQLGPLRLGHGLGLHDHVVHAGDRLDLAHRVVLDLRSHGTLGNRERQPHGHHPAVDRDLSHHAEIDHVRPEFGIEDPPEGLDYSLLR